MDKINVPAPAKINLTLSINGLRNDGYHELEMIMQTISLHDILQIKKIPEQIIVNSDDGNIPSGEKNLAYKAAELILSHTDKLTGVEIFINKNIPIAAGMAGGSTDAAAALRGINRLYALNLTDSELQHLAAELGSDVPFCLQGGTALATGRGTKIKQLPDIEKEMLVIAYPAVQVSTSKIYNIYDEMQQNMEFPKIPSARLVNLIKQHKKIRWNEGWDNVLSPVTKKICSAVQEIEDIFIKRGVKFCQMTGSGPTVFAVVNDVRQAREIMKDWPRKDDLLYSVSTVKKGFLELC